MTKISWYLTISVTISIISAASFGRLAFPEEKDLLDLTNEHKITLSEETVALAEPTDSE